MCTSRIAPLRMFIKKCTGVAIRRCARPRGEPQPRRRSSTINLPWSSTRNA